MAMSAGEMKKILADVPDDVEVHYSYESGTMTDAGTWLGEDHTAGVEKAEMGYEDYNAGKKRVLILSGY